MYNFVDLMNFEQRPYLSAESLNFDGVWLEEEIEGFRVVGVKGREILKGNIAENTHPVRDGATFVRRTYPPREIEVKYRLEADTPELFRDKYNKLNRLICKEQAVFYFNDEPDKYFIGTVSDSDDVDTGRNKIVSSFTIYCADPFKYAQTEKEFLASENADTGEIEAYIVNDGNLPVPIDFEITNFSDNGYLGIVSEYGAMQFGRSGTYTEQSTVYESKNLIKVADGNFNDWATSGGNYPSHYTYNGTSVKKDIYKESNGLWSLTGNQTAVASGKELTFYSNVSRGFRLKAIAKEVSVTGSTLKMSVDVYIEKTYNTWAYNLVKADSFILNIGGSDKYNAKTNWDLRRPTNSVKVISWTGDVPINSNGSCSIPISVKFVPGAGYNAYYPQTLSGSSTFVRAASSTASGTAGALALTANGSGTGWHGAKRYKALSSKSISFNLSAQIYVAGRPHEMGELIIGVLDESGNCICSVGVNQPTCDNSSTTFYGNIKNAWVKDIQVNQPTSNGWETIGVSKAGSQFTFTLKGQRYTINDDSLKNTKCAAVVISQGIYGGCTAMARMFVNSLLFTASDVPRAVYTQVANRWHSGDLIQIKGESGKYYLNKNYVPEDEIIGTQYFKAPPGVTTVRFYFSNNCTSKPTVVCKIREAYK